MGTILREVFVNMGQPSYNPESLQDGVKKAVDALLKNTALKNRLRGFILERGYKEEYEFFQELGLSRQYWYRVSWGLDECPVYLKIKIAKALGVDSILIWEDQDES